MRIAFLYAGQGSQKVGMGKDIYDNNYIFKNKLDEINIGFNLKELMFNGDEKVLSQTRYTQPCMAAFAIGVTEVLRENGILPEYSAGLSLGEYSALYSAGVFDEETLMNTVNYRGKVMDEAAEGTDCSMSAVMGLDRTTLMEICKNVMSEYEKLGETAEYVTITNYNCTGQYVICGTKNAVSNVELKAKDAGAKRSIKLKVSGPFHSKYMKTAGDKLEEYFKTIKFSEMKIPVIFNTTARPMEKGGSISKMLVNQVQNPIYMEDIIKYLDECNVDTVIEIGPGKALSGFVKRTSGKIKAYSIEDNKSLNNVIEIIRNGGN